MAMYTIIFFYSDGKTGTYTAGSIAQASAIEVGVLSAWYKFAIDLPNHVKIFRLTGMVLINNKYQTVVENKNYIERRN